MARLTIPDEQTFATFTVVTSTTAFPITFSLFAKSDLTVLVDGVALDQSAFTFTGTLLEGGGYDGGTVTLNTAVDDVTVRIERNVAPARTSNFSPASSVPVQSVDQALNRLTANAQDLERKKITTPVGSLAGKFLVFDADGKPAAASGTGNDSTLRTDLGASGGGALVNFLQSGTGAVARSAQTKGRDIFSAADFGATGDGAADNTAELQALLTAGAGGLVTLPKRNGIYKITSTVTVPANTFIDGQGSQIVSTMTTATSALVFTNGGGARDLTVVGPYPSGGTYVADNYGIYCTGTNNAPSAPTFVKAPKLENVEVYGYGHTGVRFRYCEDQNSTNVTARNCGYTGVAGLSCRDILIQGLDVDNITPGVSLDAYGVFFDRDEAGTLTTDPASYRCGATGINITGVRAGGNGQGVDSHGGVEIYYEGIVNDCDVMGAFTSSSVAGVATIGPKRCRAQLTGTSTNAGYGFFVVGAGPEGAIVDYAEDCVVDLNMTGHGKEDVAGSIGGVMLRATKGARVRGTLKNNRNCGVLLEYSNIAFDIDATIVDPCSTLFTAPSCVRVTGNTNSGRISAVYRYENAALATYVAVNAVRVETGLTGLDIDITPSSFVGIASGRLAITLGTTTGVRYAGVQSQTGSGSITVTNTGADGILDVTFGKRFPYVPSVQVSLGYPGDGGGKRALLEVREDLTTATGFRVYAYPADGTTWSATGALSFRWDAT
jgi:hypothetical protein